MSSEIQESIQAMQQGIAPEEREGERERVRERERDMERERERQDALLSQQCARSF
jgi:hypothetical protein